METVKSLPVGEKQEGWVGGRSESVGVGVCGQCVSASACQRDNDPRD